MEENSMILAEGQYYSLDCRETQLNNNVLVVGASGSGKTRSIVIPNILQAVGSYIIADPKGNLYKQYGDYLKHRGYEVKKLDFTHPKQSVGYNPLHYIDTEQDVLKVAHMLVSDNRTDGLMRDPYWENTAEVLVASVIAYLRSERPPAEWTLTNILRMVQALDITEENSDNKTALDLLMDELPSDSLPYHLYRSIRMAPGKTLKCITTTVTAKLGCYDFPALQHMMRKDRINLPAVGCQKEALFVVVSDTDRSMDRLANIFFTQAMDVLCNTANRYPEDRLPMDVRFILDDFATNCKIEEFPRMISAIRSRGISAMIMLQAESQLENAYGCDGRTIIANCDTYVYMGGNDVETAVNVARRCNLPLRKILCMPIGTNWIFRRGQEPVHGQNYDCAKYVCNEHKIDIQESLDIPEIFL